MSYWKPKPKQNKAPWTTMPGAKVTAPKCKTRIKPRSKAMGIKMREYMKLRAEFLNGRICDMLGCKQRAVDVHHTRGRAGKLLTAVEHWAGLCRNCHDWVGNNPEQARRKGLLCQRGNWNTPT